MALLVKQQMLCDVIDATDALRCSYPRENIFTVRVAYVSWKKFREPEIASWFDEK